MKFLFDLGGVFFDWDPHYFYKDLFKECVKNSLKNITSWNTESEYQLKKIKLLLNDITGSS